ncbi:hypothetical protein [Candidatus Mycoplasma haematohominis]|uniref:Uncharacterized protein n=1 Tax=Candidatus Mycoplasma haematohominis TaxID=1494318 RepID=A0A478FVA7_9MOLU|nr:hypothetical protein [Candidatus Mycoplasma haemohominis]GCE64055.1 hypothetical protein MHSWG343_10630 [Candidatus Mycoplasma haemohominis]
MNILQLITAISSAVAVTSTAVAGASFGGVFDNSKVYVEETSYLKSIIKWACNTLKLNDEILDDDLKKSDAGWLVPVDFVAKYGNDNSFKPSRGDIELMCNDLKSHIKRLKNPILGDNELAIQVSRLDSKFLEMTLWKALESACVFYEAMREVEHSAPDTIKGRFGAFKDGANDMCKNVPKTKEYADEKERLKKNMQANWEVAKERTWDSYENYI